MSQLDLKLSKSLPLVRINSVIALYRQFEPGKVCHKYLQMGSTLLTQLLEIAIFAFELLWKKNHLINNNVRDIKCMPICQLCILDSFWCSWEYVDVTLISFEYGRTHKLVCHDCRNKIVSIYFELLS